MISLIFLILIYVSEASSKPRLPISCVDSCIRYSIASSRAFCVASSTAAASSSSQLSESLGGIFEGLKEYCAGDELEKVCYDCAEGEEGSLLMTDVAGERKAVRSLLEVVQNVSSEIDDRIQSLNETICAFVGKELYFREIYFPSIQDVLKGDLLFQSIKDFRPDELGQFGNIALDQLKSVYNPSRTMHRLFSDLTGRGTALPSMFEDLPEVTCRAEFVARLSTNVVDVGIKTALEYEAYDLGKEADPEIIKELSQKREEFIKRANKTCFS